MTTGRDTPATCNTLGDGPAIDFVNTAEWHAADTPVETLTSYNRLVDWGQAAGLLDATEAATLLATAVQQQDGGARALAQAIAFREVLYGIFSAVARGEHAPPDDLAALNAALQETFARLQLSQADQPGTFIWTWRAHDGLLAFLAPVVRGAAELLISPNVANLRECAGHPCGWIFLDHSRNHTRRWCSMAGCGNRAKARRHYERTRVASDQ